MAARVAFLYRPGTIFDRDRRAVLKAFADGECVKTVDRYKAAVARWQKLYPDHTLEYAARHAVQIVLDSRFKKLAPLIKD